MSAATTLLILFSSNSCFVFFFYLLISCLFPFIYGCSFFFFNFIRYVLVSIFTAASLISTKFSIIHFSPSCSFSISKYFLSVFFFLSIPFTFHLYRLFFLFCFCFLLLLFYSGFLHLFSLLLFFFLSTLINFI